MRLIKPGILVFACSFLLLPNYQGFGADDKSIEAWTILRENAAEKSTEKRAVAVFVLGLLPGDPQAQELLKTAVADEKPEVREAAASALGQFGKGSIPLLHTLLDDSEPAVVLAAASSLMQLKDHAAYEVYYEFLTGQRKTSSGLIAKQMKTLRDPKKMATIGVEQGIGFIPFAGIGLSAFKSLMADDVSPIRAASAKMLANDPDPESGRALVEQTSGKSWVVRTAALEAIATRGDPKLLAGIKPALADENTSVRCTAAAAVIHLTTLGNAKSTRKKSAESKN